MTGIIITQAKEMTWISLTVDANWLFIKLTGCVKKKEEQDDNSNNNDNMNANPSGLLF